MCAVEKTVLVEMIVSSQDDVNQSIRGLLGEFVVIGFALMGNCNDEFSTLGSQTWDEFFGCCGGGFVDEIWREGVDCVEPFSFDEADDPDFDAVG